MTLTDAIALVIAVYALAAAIAVGSRPATLQAVFEDLKDRPGLAFVNGVLVYFISAGFLVAHHGLGDWREIVVTAILAASALEGLSLMVMPRPFFGLATTVMTPGRERLWAGLFAVIAAGLLALALG